MEEWVFPNTQNTNGQQVYENILSITNDQGSQKSKMFDF